MGGTGELPESESARTDSAISSISVATGLDFGFSGL
jgi:hypothetical protein